MLTAVRAGALSVLSRYIFYGWVIVAIGALGMFATGPGQSHLIGLFFEPMSRELGLSRTSVALAYGGATLVAALLLPQTGKLIDRHGARAMLAIISLGLGLSAFAFGFATSWLFMGLAFAALRFLGQGSLTLGCVNLVSQWFDGRRGLAIGVMSLGFPLSMALHPPLCQWLIEHIGWRETWRWLGVSTWVLMIPPILMLIHNRPEDVGQVPDGTPSRGAKHGPGRASAGEAPDGVATVDGFTLFEALRTRAFYILAAALFSISMLVTALHVENKGILMQHGLSATSATFMFTITGIVAAIAMPIVGHLLDRVPTQRMLSGGLLITAASLWSATLVDGLASAVVYAVIFGVNNGVGMTYFAFLWPRYFGRKHLGSIQGAGQMVGIVGASLGPLPLALALDAAAGYDAALRTLALIPLGLSFVALFLRPPVLPAPCADT